MFLEHFKAFFTGQSSSDFHTGIDGRLFYARAPKAPTSPYAVYYSPTPVGNADVFDHQRHEVEIQVNIYSGEAGPKQCADLLNACLALFDGATIPTGSTTMRIDRNFYTPPMRDGETEDAKWMASVEFGGTYKP